MTTIISGWSKEKFSKFKYHYFIALYKGYIRNRNALFQGAIALLIPSF